jgi:predicted amidophosphoribosyltransferase
MEREFNQSFIIGEESTKITRKEIYSSVLAKRKWTKDQYSLSKEETKKNIRDVFAAKNKNGIEGKKVLLVDDLFTTGCNAHEVSHSPLKSSAGEVIFFALARTSS